MAETLRNRRFAAYLAVSCAVLVALAAVSPGSFLIGLGAMVVAELASSSAAQEVRGQLRTLGVG